MFRNTPLSTRTPTLEASAQIQIDDLVQRNRALEQTNKKLSDQLDTEQRRAKDTVADIQKQLHREQREWREGCDVIVSCHRLAHLRTVAELETVRRKVIQEEEVSRQEKVKRLQRDIRILMFQIREGELEDRIADLEDEKENTVTQCEEVKANVRQKLSTLTVERKAGVAQISALEKENDQFQDKLSQLRQEYAALKTSAESNAKKLERITLQLEGAHTKNTELERTCDELKRSNAELERQLEKWQNLETKGNGEMEVLREQKTELEAKVSSLQDRLQKQAAEKDKELERLNKKDEKMKGLVAQWKDEAEEHNSEKKKAEEALAEARKSIKQLENELKTLSSSREKDVDGYTKNQPEKPSRERSRPLSKSKKAKSNVPDSTASTSDTGSSRKANRKKPKNKSSPVSETLEFSDVPPRGTKSSRPQKASNGNKGKAKAMPETKDDQDDRICAPTPKGKRRRKASPDDDNDVEFIGSKLNSAKKAKDRAKNNVAEEPAKGLTKRADDGDSGTEQAPAKKKRKINIFSNPAEPTFAFMVNDVDLGLNIPTTLSPVKEVAGVPNRSTSVSVMSRTTSRTFFKR